MNYKLIILLYMFIQTVYCSCDETTLSQNNEKIKETFRRSFTQEPTSSGESEGEIKEILISKKGETDQSSSMINNKSDISSLQDIESFISKSLTNLLERNREIIYDESSSSDELSNTYSFNEDFDYKSLDNDSDSMSLDNDQKNLPDAVIKDNKKNSVVCDDQKLDNLDGFTGSFMITEEVLTAESNNFKEKKAFQNINEEEKKKTFDTIFDSLIQTCDQERKKIDESAKIAGFQLKKKINHEIKPLSTTKLSKPTEKKNTDVFIHQKIRFDNIFGPCQVLQPNSNVVIKETSQDTLLDNKMDKMKESKKITSKINSLSSWFRRLFKFKKE